MGVLRRQSTCFFFLQRLVQSLRPAVGDRNIVRCTHDRLENDDTLTHMDTVLPGQGRTGEDSELCRNGCRARSEAEMDAVSSSGKPQESTGRVPASGGLFVGLDTAKVCLPAVRVNSMMLFYKMMLKFIKSYQLLLFQN